MSGDKFGKVLDLDGSLQSGAEESSEWGNQRGKERKHQRVELELGELVDSSQNIHLNGLEDQRDLAVDFLEGDDGKGLLGADEVLHGAELLAQLGITRLWAILRRKQRQEWRKVLR